jgi:predicted TPR repeat methyltransferase
MASTHPRKKTFFMTEYEMYNDFPQDYDYRFSHMATDKGPSYDDGFRTMRWRRYVWQREQHVLDCILQKYFSNKAIKHLDFACGTGRILQFMKERVGSCTGVDVSESMLNECRQKLPDTEILQADITKDDVLGKRTFDLITAFRFSPNAQPTLRTKAMECLSKHLSPDGLLVFNNHQNHTSIRYQIARLRGKRWRTMSNREVKDLVCSAGLAVAEVFVIGVLPVVDSYMLVNFRTFHN